MSETLKQRPYLYAYYAIMILVGVMAGCLGPVLPYLAEHTHSTLKGVSVILAMRPIGYLAGNLISGRAMDRLPGHPVLGVALLLAGLSIGFTPQMPTLSALSALVLLLGFADGTLDVGINTLLPWVYGDKVGPYFNGLHFAFGLGALAAPLFVAKSMGLGFGVHFPSTAMALLSLPVTLLVLKIPSPARHQAEKAENGGANDWKTVVLIIAIFFCYGGGEAGYGNWVYSYAVKSSLLNETGGAYLTSLYWGSLTLGRLLSIPIALKASLRSVLIVDALGSVACMGILFIGSGSAPLLWAGSAGFGLFMASFFPTLLAYAARRLSKDGRISGGVTSLFFVGSASGSTLIPWLIGQGFESQGPITAIWAVGSSAAGMALLLTVLLRKKS